MKPGGGTQRLKNTNFTRAAVAPSQVTNGKAGEYKCLVVVGMHDAAEPVVVALAHVAVGAPVRFVSDTASKCSVVIRTYAARPLIPAGVASLAAFHAKKSGLTA